MPQCVSEMVQVSNFYLQRGAAKILNKALLKFGRKPIIYGSLLQQEGIGDNDRFHMSILTHSSMTTRKKEFTSHI